MSIWIRCSASIRRVRAQSLLRQTKLFDHFVGGSEKRCRNPQPERSGRLEIDDELELGRLLDRQVCGLGTLEYLIDVDGKIPDDAVEVRAVRHQSASFCKRRVSIDRRQLQMEREFGIPARLNSHER